MHMIEKVSKHHDAYDRKKCSNIMMCMIKKVPKYNEFYLIFTVVNY